MKNRDSGESKGYAFISFKTKEIAQKAIEELHNKDFKVSWCCMIVELCLLNS